jgi:pyruvate formate lyase activating enzyme
MHVEITNLIIPDLNDSKGAVKELCDWIVENLGENTPTHFSAYHPDFQAPSSKRTPPETLDRAYDVANESGLLFPYIGNIRHEKGSNTYCPNCSHLLLGRSGYTFTEIDVKKDKECPNCEYDLKNDIIGEINTKPSHRFSLF